MAADGLTLTGTTPSDLGTEQAGYQDIPVPVYATVKGRASQIRSMPFTGDSSDDSSDGEGNNTTVSAHKKFEPSFLLFFGNRQLMVQTHIAEVPEILLDLVLGKERLLAVAVHPVKVKHEVSEF